MRSLLLLVLLSFHVVGIVDAIDTCVVFDSHEQEVTGHVFYLLSCGSGNDARFSIVSRENAESGVVVCFQEAEFDCGPDGFVLGAGVRVPCDYSDQSLDRASLQAPGEDITSLGEDHAPSGS